MIREISTADFQLLLRKYESEKTKVNVMFVATAPEFTCKIIGTVTSVQATRVVVRDEAKSCEMVFQIAESWKCSFQESKDFPAELKRPPEVLKELAQQFGDLSDLARDEMPFESGLSCFIPGRGRLALLELR
jgi:hypothetical protein